jgi:hypothetical protein
MGRLFSMGYEGLGTVYWRVQRGPRSFVFKGLGTVLVSFPIENFWDAGPPRSFCVCVFVFLRIWWTKWTKARNSL